MKRILLVTLTIPEISSGGYFSKKELKKLSFMHAPGKAAFTPPLNLATIAALTPDDVEVQIWDEAIHGLLDAKADITDYDLVGVTGYSYHLTRAIEIAGFIRSHNVPAAIGGVGATLEPERCRGHFDIVFIGEAEITWPQFIADWKTGQYQSEYRQIARPDLSLSPIPKWDSIADDMHNYLIGTVQTTRGCPFNCEFCDITYLFGKKSRHKPIDAILEEITNLERLGVRYIFFNDDNFIGSPVIAKRLLRRLITLNASFETPLEFGTQVSMNVAHDDELLELLADANFDMLLIGIESVNEASLKETKKLQNLNRDLVADCIKVQSYGMYIKAALIVGFDNDDKEIFDKQFEFMQKANIPVFNLNQLMAPPGTQLWRRMLREGRVLITNIPEYEDNLLRHLIATNIIPKQMTRVELLTGMMNLTEKLRSWDNFTTRIKGYVSGIKRVPRVPVGKQKKLSMKQLYVGVRLFFAVDRQTLRAVFDIIAHTRKHAPFLMKRVLTITFTSFFAYYFMQLKKRELDTLVRIEEALEVDKYIDHSQVIVPKSFEDSFKNIYLGVYQRVKSALHDESLVDEALVEVFMDFLTRSGRTFNQLADHHKFYLHDLCDVVVNRLNTENRTQTSAISPTVNQVSAPRHRSSSEDILNIIEQKLRV